MLAEQLYAPFLLHLTFAPETLVFKLITLVKMIPKYPRFYLLLVPFLTTSIACAQIGEVHSQNRTIIGSVGTPQLTLPYLEYVEIEDGNSNYYNLWYRNEDDPRKGIRNIQFYASDFELRYLYNVFREGFRIQLQRLTVGEERVVILRPGRSGEPMRIRIYYKDGSTGSFSLESEEVEKLFGWLKNDSLSYFGK